MRSPLGNKRTGLRLLLALVGVLASSFGFACRDLGQFYGIIDIDPANAIQDLGSILEACYEDSEYFALLGSAYLRQGDLLRSL